MKKFIQGLVAVGAFAAASVGYSSDASALDTVDKGTVVIAAERMTGFALVFGGGDVEIGAGFLTGGNPAPYNFPRIGGDYFIIDGLSLGGNLGVNHYSAGGGVTQWAILPRVGYAFALSNWIDFWPRGGFGWYGVDAGGVTNDTAVLTLDGNFLWHIFEHVGVEFGPQLDVGLANNQATTLGGNVGLFMNFK
ncbi:MAG TPA: hypothetical protein VLC09_16365 [Polyangiaceae bacterium]|nr:hypothetical protein [Polyangiaceae bacterium]